MTLVRWAPMQSEYRDRFGKMFDEFFNSNMDESVINRVWSPRVDIIEGENEVRVYADIPGMVKEDLDITLEDSVLSITGTRKPIEDREGEKMHVSERAHGKFTRRFHLQETINAEGIEASFKDGVLTLILPKVEKAKPRKIEISAA
ncbi:Hsp20/alpha crystallin family protein [bacterium]|nr:Hsp20/alpha crystallin family protein [bacterium]